MHVHRFVVLAVLCACGGKPAAPEAPAPRQPPTCTAVAEHAVTLAGPPPRANEGEWDPVRKVRNAFALRCTADKWSPEVRACFATARGAGAQQCKAQQTAEQRDALDRELVMAMKVPEPPPVPVAAMPWLPPECVAYTDEMQVFMRCDKAPQAARDAMKQGFDAMSSAWPQSESWPEEAKEALAGGCKQAADAVKQVNVTLGC